MKITVFNGSPRGQASNTHVMVEALLEGAASAGAVTQEIYLKEKHINHCQGCFACWHQTPGVCIHEDDMKALMDLYLSSDIVCFATPVYLWNMTAYLKNFLDRLIPIKRHNVIETQGHYTMENAINLPKVVVMANAGFPGDHNFETLRQVVKTGEPILEIYRNCGMLLKTQDPEVKKTVDAYLSVLKETGRQLTIKGSLDQTNIKALEMPLMTTEEYMAYISQGR